MPQLILTLILLFLLAAALLAYRLRWGTRGRSGGSLQLVERLPLGPRHSLCVVRLGSRAWLLALGDHAAPRLLAELSPEDMPAGAGIESAFRPWLTRLAPSSVESEADQGKRGMEEAAEVGAKTKASAAEETPDKGRDA